MGGKKKTKWRKVPLEEFTKEIPIKPENVPPSGACQINLTREENDCIPSFNEPSENAQNYTETYEYIDGLWYPTSCIVYNPAEVGLYSNYMMPVDTCYYYYSMPEVQQTQEYVPVPYQEYTPALPKDTVYILLPTQTLRPSPPVQNVAPEWQNRRRRRRYEGYAEYAVIPDKSSPTKSEEGDRSYVTGQLNSRKNSAQFNNFQRMTSEINKFDYCNSVSEQNPSYSKSNDMNKISNLSSDMNSVKGPMSRNEEVKWLGRESVENNQKSKKNLEMCGIHTRNITVKKEPQNVTKINSKLSLKNENNGVRVADKDDKKTSIELVSDISSSSFCTDQVNDLFNTHVLLDNKKAHTNKSIKQSDETNNMLPNKTSRHSPDVDQRKNKTKTTAPKLNENLVADTHGKTTGGIPEKSSQSSLPDILSTVNKPPFNEKKRVLTDRFESPLTNGMDLDKEQNQKSISPETSYFPNIPSAEVLQNEMEIEMKELQSLHSLQANQYIYKLAYTDQSEKDSRSPSPIDPQSQIPSSHFSNEIYVQEANSDSEPGYEDVDLLPHRYECETSRNECKHIFINKLSLAAELLRTNETLPYDAEFKRIVEDNESDPVPAVHTEPKIKHVFVDEPCSTNVKDVSQYQFKPSAISRNDSDIFRDIQFESFEEGDLCESAKEAIVQGNEIEDNVEEIRPACGRFVDQARRYFLPRTPFSLDPRYCCIIM